MRVTNPQDIAEAPYALRPLSNGDVLYRATAAQKAKASVEDRLNLLSGCASASVLDLPSAAVPFHGQQLEFGEAVERLIVSSTEGAVPADGRYVSEHMSIPLALGSVSFLAGWDRAARSGWASLVLLNDTQAEAATNIHAKMIEEPLGLAAQPAPSGTSWVRPCWCAARSVKRKRWTWVCRRWRRCQR